MADLFAGEPREQELVRVAPGAVWLRNWLSLDVQAQLVGRCRRCSRDPVVVTRLRFAAAERCTYR